MITEQTSGSQTGSYVFAALIVGLLAIIGAVVLIPMQQQALAIRQAKVYFCNKPISAGAPDIAVLRFGEGTDICGQAGTALREAKAEVSVVWETDQGDFVGMAPIKWAETAPNAEGLVSFTAIPASALKLSTGNYVISIVVGHDWTEVMRFRVEPQP